MPFRSPRLFMGIVLALAVALPAYAAPLELHHQGRVFDATGVPVTGSHTLTVLLYEDETGGSEVWSEEHTAEFDNGYFAVSIGSVEDLNADVFATDDLWVALQVDGTELGSRQKLRSVPYALRAHVADTVAGATLGSLGCGADEIPLYDGQDWGCVARWDEPVAPTWEDLPDVPSDLADGDDVLSEAEVEDYVTNGALSLHAGTTLAGSTIVTSWADIPDVPTDLVTVWADLPDVPADLADGDDVLSEAEVEDYVTNGALSLHAGTTLGGSTIVTSWADIPDVPTDLVKVWADIPDVPSDLADGDDVLSEAEVEGYVTNDALSLHADTTLDGLTIVTGWSDLTDVPTDLADGDDDSLASLGGACADDDVPAWDGAQWVCSEERVEVGDGIGGDGSLGDPLSADFAVVAAAETGGRYLEAEGPAIASNVAGGMGAVAADTSASDGSVWFGAQGATWDGSGVSGRLWGLHASDASVVRIAHGPTRIRYRMKVSDNSSTTGMGLLECTAKRAGTWSGVNGSGHTLTPSAFTVADEWQWVESTCDFQPDDEGQFIGFTGWTGALTDVSIDTVVIDPMPRSEPRLWRFDQTAGITVDDTLESAPGLEALSFTIAAPSLVRLTYSAQVYADDGSPDRQHCAVYLYLDGSLLTDSGGYGSGFIMLDTDGGAWWEKADIWDSKALAPGTHTVSVGMRQGWGGASESCHFSNAYGGGILWVEAFPL